MRWPSPVKWIPPSPSSPSAGWFQPISCTVSPQGLPQPRDGSGRLRRRAVRPECRRRARSPPHIRGRRAHRLPSGGAKYFRLHVILRRSARIALREAGGFEGATPINAASYADFVGHHAACHRKHGLWKSLTVCSYWQTKHWQM